MCTQNRTYPARGLFTLVVEPSYLLAVWNKVHYITGSLNFVLRINKLGISFTYGTKDNVSLSVPEFYCLHRMVLRCTDSWTSNFVMSVCTSVGMEQLLSHWTHFNHHHHHHHHHHVHEGLGVFPVPWFSKWN